MSKFDPDNYVRFREVAIDDIPAKKAPSSNRKSKWEVFLKEFIDAELQAVEVEQGNYKTIHHAASALKVYLKKNKFKDLIDVTVREGKLYVINKDIVKTVKMKAVPAKPPKRRGRPPKKKPVEPSVPIEDTYVGVYRGSESAEVDRV